MHSHNWQLSCLIGISVGRVVYGSCFEMLTSIFIRILCYMVLLVESFTLVNIQKHNKLYIYAFNMNPCMANFIWDSI